MSLRANLTADLKDAMRAKDKMRLKTVRLIQTELKRADIALRTEGKGDEIDDLAILALMQKMIKQRQETIKIYQDNDRPDAAEAESEEIKIIDGYLPQMKSADETQAIVNETIAALGASGMQDMGKVIGKIRASYPGAVDMGLTSQMVKAGLA